MGDSLSLYTGYWLAPYAARYGLIIGGRSAVRLRDRHRRALQPARQRPQVSDRAVRGAAGTMVARCGPVPSPCGCRGDRGLLGDVGPYVPGALAASGRFGIRCVRNLQIRAGSVHPQLSGSTNRSMSAPYNDTGEQPDGQPWDEDLPGPDRRAQPDNQDGGRPPSGGGEHGAAGQDPLSGRPFHLEDRREDHSTPEGIHTTRAAGILEAPFILPQLSAMAKRPVTTMSLHQAARG